MNKEELKELKAIKKLLIFKLVRSGATSEEIGKALGITGAAIRNIIPMREFKKKNQNRQIQMEEKEIEKLRKELEAIKKLLVLLLKKFEVKGDLIAKAIGISEGRLSQIFPQKKYKKRKKGDQNGNDK